MSTLVLENNDRLAREDPWTQILIEFLKDGGSGMTVDEARHRMLAEMPANDPDCDVAWASVSAIAEIGHAIPPEHPSATKLIDLIQALHEDPRWPEKPQITYDNMSMALTDQLSDEGSELDPKLFPPRNDIERDLRYRNFHAFAGRVCSVMESGKSSTNPWSLWELAQAHEGRDKTRTARKDAFILSAAEWIFGYGTRLYECVLHDVRGINKYTGDLWEARLKWLRRRWAVRTSSQAAKARWNFWKDGFRAVAVGKRDKEYQFATVTKEAAAKAVARMEEIERDAETDSEARSVTTIDECDDKGKGEEQDPRSLKGKFCGVFGR